MPPQLSVDQLRRLEAVPRILTPGRSLGETLTDIATLLCDLLDCRYGLVSLLGEDGEDGETGDLGAFGLADEEIARIGAEPQGHGLLRAILEEEGTLRIDDVHTHPSAFGYPDQHPDVVRVLGTRLDGAARPLGMVLLGDPNDGAPFDRAAEQLLAVFKPMAEVAIRNALLLQDARLAQSWSEAAADFMRDLLMGAVTEPLPRLAGTALELADASGIVILIRVDALHLQVLHAQGKTAIGDRFIGAMFPYAGSVSEGVIRSGEGLLVTDLGSDPHAAATRIDPRILGPAVVLPLRGAQRVRGVVVLTRSAGAARFTTADLRTAQAFTDHATVALELSAARGIEHRLEQLREEHRAARDLHDLVIQRLFATGLSFQQALPGVDGKARERIEAGMLSLEETVQEIRDKILSLRDERDAS